MTGLFEACLLCGANGAVPGTLRVGLVKWRDPVEGTEYSQLPRCSDAQACRARIEARGERWEVEDSITHSTIGSTNVGGRGQPRNLARPPEPPDPHAPVMSKSAPETGVPEDETAGWFA